MVVLLLACEFNLMQASSQRGCCKRLRSINSKVGSYLIKNQKFI